LTEVQLRYRPLTSLVRAAGIVFFGMARIGEGSDVGKF